MNHLSAEGGGGTQPGETIWSGRLIATGRVYTFQNSHYRLSLSRAKQRNGNWETYVTLKSYFRICGVDVILKLGDR